MKEPADLNENVTRALRKLGGAPLPKGMEDRIIVQMRQRQAELRSAVPEKIFWRRWAMVGTFAASVVMIVLISQHHAVPTAISNQLVANLPGHETPQPATIIARVEKPANAVRPLHSSRLNPVRVSQTLVLAPSFNAPPLPMTQQEHLLLALAQAPQIEPALTSVTTSETVVNHGLGKNAILELNHEELKPLKTTLQLTQLSTLPRPNLSGENE